MSRTDWSVLELDGVMAVAHRVAQRISNDDMPLLDAEDLEQEALIILAERADETRRYWEEGTSHLGNWLRRRLLDKARTEIHRAERHTSYEAAREGVNADLV